MLCLEVDGSGERLGGVGRLKGVTDLARLGKL